MKRDDEPMTMLDENEWRQYKRATRHFRHKQRIKDASPAEIQRRSLAWLLTVERDDLTDLVEAEQEARATYREVKS